MEKKIEILDLPPDVRELVGTCELTGRRTLFTRKDRPVAALVSYDEYLALKETVEVANDATLRAQIAFADDEVQRGALMLVEDLFDVE